jgi:biotin operon repressor
MKIVCTDKAGLQVALINAMAQHQGRDRGISAERLAWTLAISPRRLRRVVSKAREQGFAICGTPGAGYFMPITDDELDEACNFLKYRALHSLKLMSVMRKVAMPTLLGQLLLAQG